MKYFIATLLMALMQVVLTAQEPAVPIPDTVLATQDYVYIEPSAASKAYSAYRNVVTQPTFAVAKIKKLIKSIKPDADENVKLSTKAFNALTAKEKFTYCMLHQESYSQNCDANPPVEDEQKKLFAYIPDTEYEADLSNRQIDFLKKNKDSVLVWIKEVATVKKRVGVNLKEAIIAANLREAIPFLIEFFNKTKKDGDILTTLLQLMENGKYKPHLESTMRSKLYGDEGSWPRFVSFNTANTELIIKRATAYYNATK